MNAQLRQIYRMMEQYRQEALNALLNGQPVHRG